jgi:hypothetical protein
MACDRASISPLLSRQQWRNPLHAAVPSGFVVPFKIVVG